MADPVKYTISYSFTGFQASSPADPLPAPQLDAQLAGIELSIDQIVDAIKDVRRSDGVLKNNIVTRNSFATDIELGFPGPAPWMAGAVYNLPAAVFNDAGFYRLLVPHTSGVSFAADLAAGKWQLMADFSSLAGNLALLDNSVTTAKILNAAVTLAKMANLPADTVIGRLTTSGVPQAVLISDILAGVTARLPQPGDIVVTARDTPPLGTLAANGAAVAISTYGALDTAIYCGNADNPTAAHSYRCTNPASPSGSRSTTGTHIVVPDFRGEFIRGWDNGRGVDPGRNLWAQQSDLFRVHSHPYTDLYRRYTFSNVANSLSSATGGEAGVFSPQQVDETVNRTSLDSGGVETRPRNLAGLICIRY